MARYTDIDLLIDKVEGTTWYHINKNGELVTGANSETDIPLYKHSDIKRVLEEAPEADVVPKSEVERLESDNERLTDILNYYALQYGTVKDQQAVIDKAKAEVAREIFAEIENKKIFLKDHAGNMGVVVMLKDIAELKKKYIPQDCQN